MTSSQSKVASIGVGNYLLEEVLAGLGALPDSTVAEIVSGSWQAGRTARDCDIAAAVIVPQPVGMATVTEALNVRDPLAAPSTSAKIVGKLAAGQVVNVWGSRGAWRLVRWGELWGWAHGGWLK